MASSRIGAAPRHTGARAALIMAIAAAAVAMATPSASAASPVYESLTVTADTEAVVGDSIAVTVAATGLADVYAYELVVGYDASMLAFDPASPVYPPGGHGSAAPGPGTVTFSSTRFGTSPGLSGDRMLVTFQFTALSEGDTRIALAQGRVVDSNLTSSPIEVEGADVVAVVTITAPSGGGNPGSPGGAGPGDSGGVGSTTGAPGDPSTQAGALARTGTDAGTWVAVGMVAAMAALLGTVLVLRRRGGEQ